jgi:hypothetical protein
MNQTNLIANLKREKIPHLKKFIEQQYHSKYILLNDKFFDWQFSQNPFNCFEEYSMKIISLKEKILGHLGFIPISIKMFEKNYTGVFLLNLMVDEKCRGFGLGTRLIMDAMNEFSLCYTLGYNTKTEKMYLRLGNWTPMGNLRRFIKILNKENVKKIAQSDVEFEESSEKEVSGFDFIKIEEFDESIDEFWEKIKYKYPITINRTKEYLNWRYSNHPILKYDIYVCKKLEKIKGYVVTRTELPEENNVKYRIGRTIDFISEDSAEEFILNSIVKIMRSNKTDFIDFFFSGNFHIKSLISQGFVENNKEGYEKIPMLLNPISRTRNFINLIFYMKDYEDKKRELTDFNNWYVTKGDGDQDRPN